MIQQIDRQTVRELRELLQSHLEALQDKLGLKITVGGARFSDVNVAFKVEAAIVNRDGSVASVEAENFKKHAHLYGLKADDLGTTIQYGGNTFTITGLKSGRSWRYPIQARRSDGRMFKLPAEAVIGAKRIAATI